MGAVIAAENGNLRVFGEFATNVALVLETGGAAVVAGVRKASPILANLAKARQAAKAAEFAQLATKADEAVFWSGRTYGVGGESAAKDFAGKSAGTTLEMLLDKKGITMPDFNTPAGKLAWEDASLEMAKQASGKVRVVLGKDIRADSVWSRIEFPALVKNSNVKEIIAIDPKTGIQKTLLKR